MIDTRGERPLAEDARLRVVRYFSEICSGLEAQAERQARVAKVRALEARSDEELHEMGILREDIVEHVCRDAHFV